MTSSNPYEVIPLASAPALALPANLPEPASLDLAASLTFLIVRSDQAVLPNRCIYSNRTTSSDDVVRHQFKLRRWFSPSGEQRTLDLTYSVSPGANTARRCKKLLRVWSTTCIVLFTGFCTAGLNHFALGAVMLFVPIGTVLFFKSRDAKTNLALVSYRDGAFWLNGCGKRFLAQLTKDAEVG